jgi:hypothetical protein
MFMKILSFAYLTHKFMVVLNSSLFQMLKKLIFKKKFYKESLYKYITIKKRQ